MVGVSCPPSKFDCIRKIESETNGKNSVRNNLSAELSLFRTPRKKYQVAHGSIVRQLLCPVTCVGLCQGLYEDTRKVDGDAVAKEGYAWSETRV